MELEDNVGVQSISFDVRKGTKRWKCNTPVDLLEKIIDRDNMNEAYKRVKTNKGSHGIDGMKVDELLPYLKENGEQLQSKSYWKGHIIPIPSEG